MKTVGIVIARMGSTRLPGKVLMNLNGIPVISWVVNRLVNSPGIDEVWVATSTLPGDDPIVEWCDERGHRCFRGSETDVLARVYGCAKEAQAEVVVRVTGDCPFIDPNVVGQVIRLREMTGAEYASNIDPPTWPDGLDCEAMTFAVLETAHLEATRATDRDCVTRFIARNRHRFKAENLVCPLPGLHKERWVLDTPEDFEFCKALADVMVGDDDHLDILDLLDNHPEFRDINRNSARNERFYDAVATEKLPTPSFQESGKLLERARKSIPLGAQTFSKSHIQYPAGSSPIYCTHGDGAYIFDAEGNDFVDCVSGLLSVILGYRDPDVDETIRRQLNSGISFSLSTILEAELAEILCRIIPCAEMVRFGKNGSDVTAAAVRLARAYAPPRGNSRTPRKLVAVCGYHGWHDWSMGVTARNLGIPKITYEQTSVMVQRGDREHLMGLQSTEAYGIAAVIIEPDGDPDFLLWLREFCTKHGIVLIFDEIITGFRYALGGGQEYYGVTPDLACFGKAMGNGMPISAIVGRRDIMKLCEPPDNIFYSGTFFGETLSLAAAIACIKKLEQEQVPQRLMASGVALDSQLNWAPGIAMASSHPARMRIKFRDESVKTLYMKEMIARGVLIIDSFNLTLAHDKSALKRVVNAHNAATAAVKEALASGKISEALGNTPVLGRVSVRA